MPAMSRPDTTVLGTRNWNKLVSFACSDPNDRRAAKALADALAALLAECTPLHRDVTASQILTSGADGRMRQWRLPPGLADNADACAKWAALVLLDCIDKVADSHARFYSPDERLSWKERARRYTQGAENNSINLAIA